MLTSEEIKQHFPSLSRVEVYDTIDSTNTRAIQLARAGTPGVALVLADSQCRGRGRVSRPFYSPPGTGIYLTLLTRPRVSPDLLPHLTPLAAVATAEAIEEAAGVPVGVKWVNDLWLGEKKITGILTEGAFRADGTPDYAVIGIGVNVGAMTFPEELAPVASSIANETGTAPDRDRLTLSMIDRLLTRLARFPDGDFLAAYRSRSVLDGRDVTVTRGTETFDARVLGIDPDGCLRLRLPGGSERTLSSGEVAHVCPRTPKSI